MNDLWARVMDLPEWVLLGVPLGVFLGGGLAWMTWGYAALGLSIRPDELGIAQQIYPSDSPVTVRAGGFELRIPGFRRVVAIPRGPVRVDVVGPVTSSALVVRIIAVGAFGVPTDTELKLRMLNQPSDYTQQHLRRKIETAISSSLEVVQRGAARGPREALEAASAFRHQVDAALAADGIELLHLHAHALRRVDLPEEVAR